MQLLCWRVWQKFNLFKQVVLAQICYQSKLNAKMFPFYPPENINKPNIFWCFQGDQKGFLGRKGLSKVNKLNGLILIQLSIFISGKETREKTFRIFCGIDLDIAVEHSVGFCP